MPITREEEEEYEKNMYILNQIKANLDALYQQREMFTAAFIEVEKAHQSLDNLEAEKGKPELLIPLGGDCFINAKSDGVENVVVGIGSNIFVEKPLGEAREVLEKRMKLINESAQKIAHNIQDMEMKANQLNQRNQEIYAHAQEGYDHEH